MKMFATAAALSLVAATANAKTLSVNCPLKEATSLDFVTVIENVNSPMMIESFKLNGTQVSDLRDNSKKPLYRKGVFNITIAFGAKFYDSAVIQAENCTDSFEATATATVNRFFETMNHVQPTWQIVTLDCTCDLK